MKKLITYLKQEKYTLIFEVIVVLIGMILALTADSIREDYKENKKNEEAFRKDKTNLLKAYSRIRDEVVEDTEEIQYLLEATSGIHDTIVTFFTTDMTDMEFKQCTGCIFYMLTPVPLDLSFTEFRKISSLALYDRTPVYLFDIELRSDNDELLSIVNVANSYIGSYYYFMEKYVSENMQNVQRDIENNVTYFKENIPSYYYLDSDIGMAELNVYDTNYLNMLRARMDLMSYYVANLEEVNSFSVDLLEWIDLAITALEEDLNVKVDELLQV